MMVHRPERIVRLTSTPQEMEAGIIVASLEQHGIRATMTGEATAGFRAEAPGWVQVLVAEKDLLPAQAALHEIRQQRDDIDWSQVDVGQSEETHLPDTASWWTSHSFWRRVAYFVVIVILVWVIANLAAGLVGLIR